MGAVQLKILNVQRYLVGLVQLFGAFQACDEVQDHSWSLQSS
jgi:hypothetical protein